MQSEHARRTNSFIGGVHSPKGKVPQNYSIVNTEALYKAKYFLLYSKAKNDRLNMYKNVTVWEAVFYERFVATAFF